MKNALLNKFNRLYKGCTLYAIHLNGFSHEVFYKDQSGAKHIESVSAYASEIYEPSRLCTDNVYRAFNADITQVMFSGIAHYCYQNNAVEYCYKEAKDW